MITKCTEGPAWLWDWIDTQCVQGLHSSDCDQCEPFPGFCAADAASCLNGNHDALSLGCPYPLCRESVLKVVGTYVCVFMMAYNLIVSILHLICMVCVCSQGKYVNSTEVHKVVPNQVQLTPSAPDPPSVESILLQPFTQEGQVF
ncbi:hypothetical protein EON65_24110 [archaeon]|nr:MAG: hypothetical protein EON65_24110 [archaeon]